jgi:hypothetical protein
MNLDEFLQRVEDACKELDQEFTPERRERVIDWFVCQAVMGQWVEEMKAQQVKEHMSRRIVTGH